MSQSLRFCTHRIANSFLRPDSTTNFVNMRFSSSAFLAVAAAPLLALAQNDSNGSNPFNIPTSSLNTEAGETVNLTWKPTTQGTVTIYLRSGASNNLNKGVAIACTSSLPKRINTKL